MKKLHRPLNDDEIQLISAYFETVESHLDENATSDQFMSIFLLIRDKLEDDQIEYSGVSVCQD